MKYMLKKTTFSPNFRYPCLRYLKDNPGYIVLFVAPKKGLVVQAEPPTQRKVGEYYIDFDMERWEIWHGSITLTEE